MLSTTNTLQFLSHPHKHRHMMHTIIQADTKQRQPPITRKRTQTPPTVPCIQNRNFIWVQQNFLTLLNAHSKHNAFCTWTHQKTLTLRKWQRQIQCIIKHPRRWSASSLSLLHFVSLFHSVCTTSLFSVTNVASRIMWRRIKLQLSQQPAWASDECWWI